jgi:2-polyprenyl-6-methoxyphenol hydroxylase-like FAD-dependent oxidoreductase
LAGVVIASDYIVSAQMRDRYDVIVIGAGPGGAATATLLARRGRNVLLLDRAGFPRSKLCTHAIMPAGLPVLAELGVLDQIEMAGAQRWYGVRLWLNGCRFAERLPHHHVAYPYGLSLRRHLLDAILLDAASREPALDLRTGCAVAGLLREQGRVAGVVIQEERGRRVVGAPFVVLAGGRHTRLVREAGVRALRWPNRHTAYIAYLDGVPREEQPGLEGYYWHGRSASLLPADCGLRVAGVMAPPGSWPPGRWEQRLLDGLRRFPPLRNRLAHARVASPPVSVSGLVNVWRRPLSGNLLLVGDAGLQTDPLFGQGISWALREATWATAAIDRAQSAGRPSEAVRRYEAIRTRVFGPRYVAMAGLSAVPPASMLERLLIANAAFNPESTAFFLRLMLGFGTVSRERAPRRSPATWLREALNLTPRPLR